MSVGSLRGNPGIHMFLVVPAEKENELDAFFGGHEAFMRAHHVVGRDINEFWAAKGREYADPLAADKTPTGNITYALSEAYCSTDAIATHMASAEAHWSGFPTLVGEYLPKYAKAVDVGTAVVQCTFFDGPVPKTTAKGDAALLLVLRVPADKVDEVDNFWKEHEKWMRESHQYDTVEGNGPRLTSYTVCKGPELKDPLAQPAEPTGFTTYVLSETYVAASDIGLHLETGAKSFSHFNDFQKYLGEYTVVMDASLAVIASVVG